MFRYDLKPEEVKAITWYELMRIYDYYELYSLGRNTLSEIGFGNFTLSGRFLFLLLKMEPLAVDMSIQHSIVLSEFINGILINARDTPTLHT